MQAAESERDSESSDRKGDEGSEDGAASNRLLRPVHDLPADPAVGGPSSAENPRLRDSFRGDRLVSEWGREFFRIREEE